MDQLFRREFLLMVLMTVGTASLKGITGFTEYKIADMAIGKLAISDDEVDSIFKALSEGA